MRTGRWLWLLLLTGCPWEAPTPIARVRHGPAFHDPARTIAVLPIGCTVEPKLCTAAQAAVASGATRKTLELKGYSVIDFESLNAELRRRSTRTREEIDPPRRGPAPSRDESPRPDRPGPDRPDPIELIDTRLKGATWTALPPEHQLELLQTMGASGTLRADLQMSRPRGMALQSTIQIAITVRRLDGALVWHSECGAETGDYHSNEQAIDLALRCALEAGSLW